MSASATARERASGAEVAATHRSRARAGGVAQLLVLASPVALLGVGAWHRRWIYDDGFINFRIVDMVLANPKILGKFRAVPSTRNGKREGAKIFAIQRSSLLAMLGFANGDTVLAINKRSIDPPEDLHELHTMFRDTKLVVIDLERRGKPVMMMFKVTQ